jgi:hypothetical protein
MKLQKVIIWSLVVLAGTSFFGLAGPPIGALLFIHRVGPIAAIALGYPVGMPPALIAGSLNALLVISNLIGFRSLRSRALHALAAGSSGLLATVLYLDSPDWALLEQLPDWYGFWYTFRELYAEIAIAGCFAGAVCGAIFNPWAQARMLVRVQTANGG